MSKNPNDPTIFRRGTTFSYAVNIPSAFHDGYFRLWDIKASVRKLNNETRNGLVGTLLTHWENALTTRRLIVFNGDTDQWGLGPAETDVLFISSTGYRIRTKPLFINIERGVTK